ncbi:PEP/pyruvate-binding domain-containing protein [Austwickia sp. TVS 96-490-7B]|uniref:PEP/pyruvate-binding domain-containing protein n=1 Tax=Austwickia sp. TVS 96-490-7B TaxID=2830843 RepID=UPI001C599279|nr:PEP/pyruvate-binding domain-containing protein [Austwickia sp. TVS 96-490-7B]
MLIGDKAATLAALRPFLREGAFLPHLTITRSAWHEDPEQCLDDIEARQWVDGYAVRSSASSEDSLEGSHAGVFDTVLRVGDRSALTHAIDKVFKSYDRRLLRDPSERVLVQPMVRDALLSGVASSLDHVRSGPYWVLNYSAGADTTAVTSGTGHVITYYIAHGAERRRIDARLDDLLLDLDALNTLMEVPFEVEFAVSPRWGTVILQVRPLAGLTQPTPAASQLLTSVARDVKYYLNPSRDRPAHQQYPAGNGPTLLGIMPDWNPAEIIGTRPRRLATSLYRNLVTDRVWAHSRMKYGYKDLTGFPLLVEIQGLPYIDVRTSCASLIPAALPPLLTRRLADHYIAALRSHPELHDKLEFDVVHSMWGPASNARMERQLAPDFTGKEQTEIRNALIALTNDLIDGTQPWRADQQAIRSLPGNTRRALKAPEGTVTRIEQLLDPCRKYGTEPFAGLARAAFIATELLAQAVEVGALTAAERDCLLASAAGGVTSDLVEQLKSDRDEFLRVYGHLRPGTYDILSPRYDEGLDRYFGGAVPEPPKTLRALTEQPIPLDELSKALRGAGLDFDALTLVRFAQQVVRGRETSKLAFTRNVSDALTSIKYYAHDHGLSIDDASHLSLNDILRNPDAMELAELAAEGREQWHRAQQIVLPPLVADSADVWCMQLPPSKPNFITCERVIADVADIESGADPECRIALIRSADPGYDWIFARGVAGLITAYGGVNSHMAIRAREFHVPTMTGTGEQMFNRLRAAARLELDCGAQTVRILQ